MEQVILDLGKRSYFAFVEGAILVHGRDFSVFFIGNVCLRGQFLINLICTQCNLCNLGRAINISFSGQQFPVGLH